MATRSRKLTGSAGALLNYFKELRLRGLESYCSSRSSDGNDPADDIVFDELRGNGAERLGVDKLTHEQFTDLVNGEWAQDAFYQRAAGEIQDALSRGEKLGFWKWIPPEIARTIRAFIRREDIGQAAAHRSAGPADNER